MTRSPSTARSATAGSGKLVRVPRARRWRFQHREHLLGGGHALGACVVVGAELAKREECLRGEHEREQRGAQVEVPAHQPQADRHRHERHGDVATSSRISEDRKVIRSVEVAVMR